MKKTFLRLAASAALVSGVGAAVAFADPGPRGPGGPDGFGPGFGPGFGAGRIDFEAIDANADGKLDRAELTGRAMERIAVFDLDKNGQIDRAELIAALPAREGLNDIFAPNPAERMADRILAMHGATADGAVPVAQMAEQRVNMVFAALDEDGDGVIVLDEIRRDGPGGPGGPGGHERRHGDHGPRD